MYPGMCFVCGATGPCEHREIALLKLAAALRDQLTDPPRKPSERQETEETTERTGT